MAGNLETIFSNGNIWISIRISLILIPNAPISNKQANGLVPDRRQAIIWTNDGLVYWPIYTSLGLNEFLENTIV